MLVPAVATVIVIIAFINIYRRYKTDNEEFLVFKLIGYYLLGSFRLNFNNIALPVGFIIYSACLRPRTNKPVKRAIAYLGLFAFFSSILNPFIEKAYFERGRVVSSASNNIYTIDFNADYNVIKKRMGVGENTRLEEFQADFEQTGIIKRLTYKFLTIDSKGTVLYRVDYNTDKNKYIIKPTKVNQWPQYNELIGEEQFFYGIKHLDLKKAIPNEEYPYYTVRCAGTYSGWDVKDFENFWITDKGFRQISNEELPVEGYVFWIYGNKKTDEGDHISYSSDHNRAYILSNSK
ncbi:hypothetical protein HMPREF1982_00509 [Clostridiales bacterium oral taxon 876 str. F0540]|nr:hypothetical protein HMPREF1982_00509 [Clostridiales bacterium oral taxon 876 str. F0540]